MNNETPYTGEVHYFASCAFGWATADSRKDAVEKLVKSFRRDLAECVKNIRAKGDLGAYVWSCQVNAPAGTNYEINFYSPQGVEKANGMHHLLTRLTAKDMVIQTFHKLPEDIGLEQS